MSLLDELKSLDVSSIVNARASLTAAIQTPDLGALAARGSTVALGDVGRSLQSLQGAFPTPEALLRPLMSALDQLAPQLDARHLPIAPYVEAVREGATLASGVLNGFNDHPADWGRSSGRALGDALQFVGGKAGEIGGRLGQPADRYAELLKLVEHPPADALALAQLVLELILPFPQRSLASLRDGARQLTDAAAGITLPAGRTAGLTAAFDVVAKTAPTGDAAALAAALRELDRARRQTIATLQDDLRFVGEQVARLRVPQVLNPLAEVSLTIRSGRDGVIEFMRDFGHQLGEIRFQIEHLDVERVRLFLREIPELVEKSVRDGLEKPVDAMVVRAREALRDLFRRLPVREYRAEVSQFLHAVAERIQQAGLDGPARAARGALSDASTFLTSNGLQSQVQAEVQRINAEMQSVLDKIEAALDAVADGVDAVADRAVDVLNRAADALTAFQQAIDAVHAAVDQLGVHEAEQQIVDALQNLRKKAEDLLSKVPLPDQIRPQVEQLTETLRTIDFDELLRPVREAAAQITIPPEVTDAVHGGLEEAKRVIEHLIPQQLIDGISHDIGAALDSIRSFDPARLLPDLSSYLEQAAAEVEKLDPRHIAESVRGPYAALLDVIDRAHPVVLLKPVIDAYDSLVGSIPAPSPVPVAHSLGEAFDGAGRVAGRALVEPAARLTPDAKPEVGDPSSPRPIEVPADLTSIRPGDAIRVLGYLPGRLRDALHAVEAGVVGDVVKEIDSCCSGLAHQLRTVPDALAGVESRIDRALDGLLAPVASAQARAQLALHAHVDAGTLSLHLDAVALSGPAGLRAELTPALAATRDSLRRTTRLATGRVKQAFDGAAAALETSPLASLAGNLDGLLAVLDPEPLAHEMDLIMTSLLSKAGPLLTEIRADLESAMVRLRAIVSELNPMALAQRFLSVLDVLREELDILNPKRLAMELGEIHTAIRAVITAYDPRVIAEDLAKLSRDVAQQIRALNPRELLGDLSFWQDTIDRLSELNPATRLAAVGAALRPVGDKLGAIDVGTLIESVNALSPILVHEFELLIDAIRNEIVALLESLRFATGNATASASVSVG